MTTHVTLERMITFLLGTPMFEKLDPAEIKQLVHIIEVKEFAAGDILFKEGDPGDAWYALYRGKVDVIKNVGTNQKEIYPLGEGACFGEIAILDGQPRSATIQAIEDSVALRISRQAFEELLDQEHTVAFKLLRLLAITLAQRARSTTERLSELVLEAEAGQVQHGVTQIVDESYLRD
jgi:CRP-like cAMP-binding protein